MFQVEHNANKTAEAAMMKAVREGKNAQEAAAIGRQARREAIEQGNKWISENVGLN